MSSYVRAILIWFSAITFVIFSHVLFDFFFNDTATTEIYTYLHTVSLHDALPISTETAGPVPSKASVITIVTLVITASVAKLAIISTGDRKSTRLNSSH